MQKTTKGALAAAAAAVLLLGGAGSLAYWNATETVPGGTINSGHLTLTPTTGTGCAAWELNGGATAYAAGDPLVPGDVLSENCSFTIAASGNDLTADVTASAANVTGPLAAALTVSANNIEVDGAPATSITSANDGQTLSLAVSVTFNATSDNTTQDLTAALADITITAQQTHA